jgi:hypothetical protein
MKVQSPVMMDEYYPVRLEEDSKEEFYYNLANDSSPVMGEYSSLFMSQQSTIDNRICCSNSISHHYKINKQPIPFSLGSIHTPNQFCRVRPKSE